MTEQSSTSAPEPGASPAQDSGAIDLQAWASGQDGLPDQRQVPDACVPQRSSRRPGFRRWAMQGAETAGSKQGPHGSTERTHSWLRVMCLTGVDYFSSLGYQPAIAAIAAGFISPVATLVLVLLTLFGALPVYRRVASESFRGEGSIAMLERLLPWWAGKLFVLVLLGFAGTAFIITITLSAADAAAHAVENPLMPAALHSANLPITLLLIVLLGAVFLRGFQEAIGIAVVLVAVFLTLNAVVIVNSFTLVAADPAVLGDWTSAMLRQGHGSPIGVIALALVVFPQLALGLSGSRPVSRSSRRSTARTTRPARSRCVASRARRSCSRPPRSR